MTILIQGKSEHDFMQNLKKIHRKRNEIALTIFRSKVPRYDYKIELGIIWTNLKTMQITVCILCHTKKQVLVRTFNKYPLS